MTLALLSLTLPVLGQDEYRDGRLRYLEQGVVVQRSTETTAEEAIPNLPFLPGDRVWTDASGRAEFQFVDGSLLRLDSRSKLDYAAQLDESGRRRLVLQLWSGNVQLVAGDAYDTPELLIETPGGIVTIRERGTYRVDTFGAETWLRVYEGRAELESSRGRVQVLAGEQAYAVPEEHPGSPEPIDRSDQDAFAHWNRDRDAEQAWASNSQHYLPSEVAPYAADLENHGTWHHENDAGYVWRPHVSAGWQPYSNGHWTWTAYGWTWVPYEPWGWAPFHYGSWGFSVSLGWYWVPGRTWGPAWVSWSVGPRYVGWCPLGRRGRPVVVHHHRGRRHRGRDHHRDSWHYVERGHLGRRHAGRHRVAGSRVRDGEMRHLEAGHRLDRRLDVTQRRARRRPSMAAGNRGHAPLPSPRGVARGTRRGGERTRARGTPRAGLRENPSRRRAVDSRRSGAERSRARSSQREVLGGFFRPLNEQGSSRNSGARQRDTSRRDVRTQPRSRPRRLDSPGSSTPTPSRSLNRSRERSSSVAPRRPNSRSRGRSSVAPSTRSRPRNRSSARAPRSRSSNRSSKPAPSVRPRNRSGSRSSSAPPNVRSQPRSRGSQAPKPRARSGNRPARRSGSVSAQPRSSSRGRPSAAPRSRPAPRRPQAAPKRSGGSGQAPKADSGKRGRGRPRKKKN